MKKLLLGICILVFQAQNVLQAQTTPFPANRTYQHGLTPGNRSGSDASSNYNTWKNNYLTACNNGRYRVRFDDPSQTVSEGIAYGMLLAAYAADRPVFDGLWLYYKDFRNRNGVMHWKISGCNSVVGQNGATDAEVDAAMALIVAHHQWGSTGSINYNTDARALIAAIKTHEVESGSLVLKPGDMFGGSNITNPSYFAPGYFRIFGEFTNDASFWNGVASRCYSVINNNLSRNNAVGGLVSDWCRADGTYSSDASGYFDGGRRYHYDAARTPWRIAVDFAWYGNADAKTYSKKSSDFVRVNLGGSRNVRDGYYQNGRAYGQWHNSTFTGAFACAAIAGENQTHLNDSYSDLRGINDANSYFNQTLKTLYMFFLTGNFYKPGSTSGGGGGGTTPNVAPTVSITSPANGSSFTAGANITVTANASDSDGSIARVEFFNGTTKIGESTTAPYSVTWTNVAAGSYSLTARATDNAGATTTSAAVNITVSNPVVTRGPYGGTRWSIPGKIEAENYDTGGNNTAYRDLTSGNSGAAYRNDDVDIESTSDAGGGFNVGWVSAGEWLEYSVNVTTAGRYDLIARVASTGSGKTFHIQFNGVNVSGAINVPNTSGWQNWQTVTIPSINLNQGNQIMRIAMDTDGFNLNFVEFVPVTSTPINQAPSVAITSPANNATFTAGTNITISANASDVDGTVSRVEFFQGSTKLGERTSSPYSFTWNSVVAGSYTLTARATDNAGATTVSSPVNITVTSPDNGGGGGTGTGTCVTRAIPNAADFVVRNSWADQNNGSSVATTTDAMRITHRQWGNSVLYVIESARQTSITAGRTYSISFDFLDDPNVRVQSVEAGFARSVDWSGPVLHQPLVTAAAGYSPTSYTRKTVNITAATSGTVYLTFAINWSSQPSLTVNNHIKNISVCESSTAARKASTTTDNSLNSANVSPNPFQDQTMIFQSEEGNAQIMISDITGNIVSTHDLVLSGAPILLGSDLKVGTYIVTIICNDNKSVYRLVKQ